MTNELPTVGEAEVDARGQRCPMPLLMAKRALRDLPPGGALTLWSTDPGSIKDFQSLQRLAGHSVESKQYDNGEICHRIIKAQA